MNVLWYLKGLGKKGIKHSISETKPTTTFYYPNLFAYYKIIYVIHIFVVFISINPFSMPINPPVDETFGFTRGKTSQRKINLTVGVV